MIFSLEEKQQILVDHYINGVTYRDLSKKFNTTYRIISNLCNSHKPDSIATPRATRKYLKLLAQVQREHDGVKSEKNRITLVNREYGFIND